METLRARDLGRVSHDVFRHDWPIGQCGPCLDFGDRLVHIIANTDAKAALLAALTTTAPPPLDMPGWCFGGTDVAGCDDEHCPGHEQGA